MATAIGITASKSQLVLVRIDLAVGEGNPCTVIDDRTVPLQEGCRGTAYRRIQEWLVTYLRECAPDIVAVKGSAVSGKGAATLGLLEGTELRGVTMAAAIEADCSLAVVKKAAISRTFGERKVDAYVGDEEFWAGRFAGDLRKGSRETALFAFVAGSPS